MKITSQRKIAPETQRALEAITEAVAESVRKGGTAAAQEQLTMVATIAICMIHGTFGQSFCREYLRGAMAELDLPNGLKIQLEVADVAERH